MRTTTPTKNKEKLSRPTSLKASTKSTPYPSSEISNRSLKDTTEEHSAQTAINWDTGKKTAVSTNAHIAISTNPTTKNTYVFFDPLDLMVDPKPLSNRNRHHHHPSPSESPTREDSKPRNLPPLSHHPPHLPLPAEKSPRTREKERRKTTTPANKEKSKEKSTKLSTKSRRSGTEEWRNSPNNRMNPMNTTTRPSTTSTKSHPDFRSSWKFRTIDGG